MPEIETRILDVNHIPSMLQDEYSALRPESLAVLKRFVLSDGRVSNAFLINSDNLGRQKFIAKGYVRHPESLVTEWYFLKHLQKAGANAPRLSYPEHQPQDLLLMEYVSGPNAPEALNEGQDPNVLFRKIGETSGKIHTIDIPFIGTPRSHKDETWRDHQMERLNSRLVQMKELLGEADSAALDEMIADTEYILNEESEKEMKIVHRDLYLDNFIVDSGTGEVILIDYGIAMGGRPLYDLAKFYIWTLSKYPEQIGNFFEGYREYVDLPENLSDILRFYIIRELFGMIDFFGKVGYEQGKKESSETLRQFVRGQGVLNELLKFKLES